MPDTKIKQLSTIISMQQSVLVSTQRSYNRQFSRSMKDHTNKINRVRDELNRLRMDKDRYQKQQKRHMAYTDDIDSTPGLDDDIDEHEEVYDVPREVMREEFLQMLKHKSHEKCKMLSKKVKDFTEKLDMNTNASLLESLRRKDHQKHIRIEEKPPTQTPQRAITFNDTIRQGARQRRRSSSDARRGLHLSATKSNSPQTVTSTQETSLPSFHSDQFVNTMVSNARARLVALYQQSILGPGKAALIKQKRSQSATASARPKSIMKRRNAVSATINMSYNYNVDRRPEIFYRRSFSRESRPDTDALEDASDDETEGSQDRQSEQDSVQQLRTALGDKYVQFEDALNKRMMIRDMRAAEYDVKHGLQPSTAMVEILPSKNSNISMALRRQSAIVALERSFLGQSD